MDSASIKFIVFGLAVALISNCNRSRVWRFGVLAVANITFLALLGHHPVTLLPLTCFLLLGYGAIVMLRRQWLQSTTWSILALVFAYAWLKKYTFFPKEIFLHFSYFTLGLSYVFFRVLHLLIETGDGEESRRIGFAEYLLYTLNFTTLISGPIQRYDDFARDQLAREPLPLGLRVAALQAERIVRGFFKVNVLATLLHAAQRDALANLFQPLPLTHTLVSAVELIVVYPLFLYCNFSGYIDIVIALARLMRVQLPENFNRPFAAASFLEFWTRWHISLSTWFKSYVYNPLLLMLMRRISNPGMQPLIVVVCFFVTFFLVGIWHGRTSEFLFYGLLQGGSLAVNKLWQMGLDRGLGRARSKEMAKHAAYVTLSRGLTYVWFCFTLFWFWADWHQIGRIFGALQAGQWCIVWLAAWLIAAATLLLWEKLRAFLLSFVTWEGPVFTSRYARVVYASALGLASFVMTVLLNQAAPDIVYKAF